MKLVVNMDPKPGNARNSEGSFIRMPDGGILFAYSRYSSNTTGDDGCLARLGIMKIGLQEME